MRFGDRNPIPLPTTQLSDRVEWSLAETPAEIAAVADAAPLDQLRTVNDYVTRVTGELEGGGDTVSHWFVSKRRVPQHMSGELNLLFVARVSGAVSHNILEFSARVLATIPGLVRHFWDEDAQ